jgi:hypothetical protein
MKPLRFLQIPKTAGSTLAYLLIRRYPRYFAFRGEIEPDTQRYLSLSEKEKQEIELFLGHAPIKTGIADADRAILFTLLRNPVSRVKSFCQHAAEGKSPYLLKDFPPESFDVDKLLNSGTKELSNLETKMLINTGSCHSPVLMDGLSPAAARDLALENLQTAVSRFGIQEYFDESLILFSQFFNWGMPFYLSANQRDSKRLIEFKQSHLDRIAELNAIDIEVYNAAKEKFLTCVASPDYDQAKLKSFKALNPLVAPALKLRNRIEKRRHS